MFSLAIGLLQKVANVDSEVHPAVCRMSSRLTGALLAADALAALVLCGLNRDVSIPKSVRTDLTQQLTVSLLTFLKGF